MSNKHIYQAFALLLTCHLVIIFLTFGDYGMSWDQPGLHEYGKAVLRFYESLGRDAKARTHELRLYGGKLTPSKVDSFWIGRMLNKN
jgi:hypothetical protein